MYRLHSSPSPWRGLFKVALAFKLAPTPIIMYGVQCSPSGRATLNGMMIKTDLKPVEPELSKIGK